MQPLKKQFSALGLLLLVALPIIFSVGLFIKQKILQNQRIERFDTEQLQTITVSAEKLYWTKPGKEILLNGKLFDVKTYKTAGGNVILSGFFDDLEDKLVDHINDINQQKNDSNSPISQLTVKFLCFPSYKEITVFSLQNNWQAIANLFPVYTECISNMTYPAPTPPPKYC